MSEMNPETSSSWRSTELVDKPIDDMTPEQYVAWYLQYMKTVDEDNIMMVSGLPMEIHDDPKAFRDYVTVHQQLMREGLA